MRVASIETSVFSLTMMIMVKMLTMTIKFVSALVAPERAVLVEELLVREPLHLVLGEHTLGYKMLYSDDEGHDGGDVDDGYDDDDLGRAVRIWARDVVGSLHHLERYVLLHALQQGIFKDNVHIVKMTSLQKEQPHSSNLTMAEAGQS